jgi:high affinity Mn2+ porin
MRLKRSVGLLGATALAVATLFARPLRAQVGEAAPRPDEQFDFMNLLSHHGLHDIKDESWNAYGQVTYIQAYKAPFHADYTNAGGSTNSLLPTGETSFTGTFTLFLGAKLWPGAAAYIVPEVITERPLSDLHGLGSTIQNFELQKNGSEIPTVYRSRAYVQQTIELGGSPVVQDSNPMQLGTTDDSRRIVIAVGNYSVLDFFDKNTFASDLRQQFFNMAFLTYAAYDFAADARGYAYGATVEGHYDDWAARVGRFTPPQDPNQLALNFDVFKFYGDQAEVEHAHKLFGRDGVVRILGFRNRENMGRFDDAVAAFQADPAKNAAACGAAGLFNYGSNNAHAPDLCWVRRPQVKLGIGINLEQYVTDDIGVFFRAMYADGQTEVYSYTSTDRSLSFGGLAHGSLWHRPNDVTGIGAGLGWISRAHAEYLRLGGIDGFIGDGNISQAAETVLEAFYSVNVVTSLWLSGDYQIIFNPAYNSARGPVNIVGGRVHAEF